jgi:hypothetical protein
VTNRSASNGRAEYLDPFAIAGSSNFPSTPPGNFFRRFRTALGPGGHPGDESRRLSTVLRCAQYRMVAGPMGHGSRLCFRSGLAGVAQGALPR